MAQELPTFVSLELLEDWSACEGGLEYFDRAFPEGVAPTLRAFRVVARRHKDFLGWFLGQAIRRCLETEARADLAGTVARRLVPQLTDLERVKLAGLLPLLDGPHWQRAAYVEQYPPVDRLGYYVLQCLLVYGVRDYASEASIVAHALDWEGRTAHHNKLILEAVSDGLGFPRE